MKQTLVQLLVGLIGLSVLIWGEYKDYVQKHPEMISTWQLEAKQMLPVQYYMYQVAYDPNNNKTWYLYNNGYWYDKPPQIRKHQNQSEKVLGTSPGTQQSSLGSGSNGQSPQAGTYPQRY